VIAAAHTSPEINECRKVPDIAIESSSPWRAVGSQHRFAKAALKHRIISAPKYKPNVGVRHFVSSKIATGSEKA
jgi:hypothetical protein